jgi:acyl carrier protein
MSTFEQLQQAIAATLKVSTSKITEKTRDEDIAAWDSLGHDNLMMTVEQTFDIMLDVEDFAALNSVQAILEYLKKNGID